MRSGWPEEYSMQYLKEKYFSLDWVAVNLIFNRPIGTQQLLLYGLPNTPKTLVFQLLNEVLHIHHATTNDYTGAHDDYDLWLFDDLHIVEDSNMSSGFGQSLTSSANNTLLHVLNGEEFWLDMKDGRAFTKVKNVPIVGTTNKLVRSLRESGPFLDIFFRLDLKSRLPLLRSERLISTLFGCINRRLQQKDVSWNDAKFIYLQYNEEHGKLHLFPASLTTPLNSEISQLRAMRSPEMHQRAGALL